jgi:hypothetical protein
VSRLRALSIARCAHSRSSSRTTKANGRPE